MRAKKNKKPQSSVANPTTSQVDSKLEEVASTLKNDAIASNSNTEQLADETLKLIVQ